MKWMKRSAGLRKRLENVNSPGKRLKLIREARNSTAEFKGKCGLRALSTYMAQHGCVGDDSQGRKIVKDLEIGTKRIPINILDPWLKFLDTTAKEAGIELTEEEGPEPQKSKVTHKSPNQVTSVEKPTSKVVFVNHCEGMSLEIFVEQYQLDGSIHVHIFHDEPVPEKMLKDFRQGVRMGRTWVPESFQKYAHSANPEDRQVVSPRKTVDLSK